VVRSTQTKEENSSNASGDKTVTVANQVPGGSQDQGGATNKEASNTSEETVNYEISRTSRTEVMEAGRIRRISVALLVDGLYANGPDGAVTYQPRPKEDLDRIGALVRSAVGFDEKRGDQVEVVNLRFAEAPPSLPLEVQKTGFAALFDFGRDDMMRLIELGALLVTTLLVLLFAVRPLLRRVMGPEAITAGNGIEGAIGHVGAAGGAASQLGPDGNPSPVPLDENGMPAPDATHPTQLKIEQAKALGALQAGSVLKIGEMVQQSPGEAAAIIRGWLQEAA
jgi:flagellar M-ring protein FliF